MVFTTLVQWQQDNRQENAKPADGVQDTEATRFRQPSGDTGQAKKATSNAFLLVVRFGPLCALICPPCVPIACRVR